MRVRLALVLGLALGAGPLLAAPPSPSLQLAAGLLAQTAYRLDDEVAADEADGARAARAAGYPATTARLGKVLDHAFGPGSMRSLRVFRSRPLDLLAFGAVGHGRVWVAYRGSRGPTGDGPEPAGPNWGMNHLAAPEAGVPGLAPRPVHAGYGRASRALQRHLEGWLRNTLDEYPDHALVLTGHSLGGALAGYGALHLLADPGLTAALRHPDRPPGLVLTFGAPAVDYSGCRPSSRPAPASALAAAGLEAYAAAFDDDAAPILLRAALPCARRLGAPVSLGSSPEAGPAIDAAQVLASARGASPGARTRAAAARWMNMDSHYAFHYVRQLASRLLATRGSATFDPDDYRRVYGVPLPLTPEP